MDFEDYETIVSEKLDATKLANIYAIVEENEGLPGAKPEGNVQTAPAVVGFAALRAKLGI